VTLRDFRVGGRAEVRTLSADVPWAANSLVAPETVKPVDSTVDVQKNGFEIPLRPFTVVRLRVPR
jgi:hypothetical protein